MRYRVHPTHRRSVAISLALCLVACGSAWAQQDAPAPDEAGVAIQPGRPDASRTAEPAALAELQRRLDADRGRDAGCEPVYSASLAQAWLNFSRYAATEQVPKAVQAAALAFGQARADDLANRRPSPRDTEELPGARHVRDDLWKGIDAVRREQRRLCAAPKMTAYCEVQLAWAGYESSAGGWKHTDPYVRIAEDYCTTAIRTPPLPPPPAAETPAPAPIAAATPAPLTMQAVVLFPHNRSHRRDMRRPGPEQLKALAAQWRAHGGRIQIVGHADITGHSHYNLLLSERRAQTVRHELELLGIPLTAMRIEAVGSAESVVECRRPDAADRRRYLSCLEPNRRVTLELETP